MTRLHDAVLAAIEAEGGSAPMLSIVIGTGIPPVYHGAVDTGIRFALAAPELARRFIVEYENAMGRSDDLDNGADALVREVSKWKEET